MLAETGVYWTRDQRKAYLTGRNTRLARRGIEPGTYRSAVTFDCVNGAHYLLSIQKRQPVG